MGRTRSYSISRSFQRHGAIRVEFVVAGSFHDVFVRCRRVAAKLDGRTPLLAAHDFRSIHQRANESVSDYIRRLEEAYRATYPNLKSESRDCLLFYQMQEGLLDQLARAPQVSGALSYTQLCQAALFEERRLAMLQVRGRRADFFSRTNAVATMPSSTVVQQPATTPEQPVQSRWPLICFNFQQPGHVSRNALNALQKALRLRLGVRLQTLCQLIVPSTCRQIYSVYS